MRVLSGIQPTGRFHWGNYFGAIRQYIALQDEDEAYYFIANLHALTTVRDPRTDYAGLLSMQLWIYSPWGSIRSAPCCLSSRMFPKYRSCVGC